MSWKETAACFLTNWDTVCRSVKPYLNVIAAMLPAALNVLDRFHIAQKLGEVVDAVRRQVAKQLAVEGYEPVLKNSRYCFLKRRSNLTIKQATNCATCSNTI